MRDMRVFKEAESSVKDYNFIVFAIIVFVLSTAGGIVGEILDMIFKNFMPAYLSTAIFSLIIGFGSMVLLCFLIVKKVEKRSIVGLGFYKEGSVKKYFIGFAAGIMMMLTVVVIGSLTGAYSVSFNGVTIGGLIPIIVMLIGFVVQGAAEEVLVRGWMLPLLAKRYNVAAGIILSSVFFAAFHAMNPGMTIMPVINLVLCGLFLGLYYVKEQSLWGVFGLHTAWNWCQGNLFGIKVSGTGVPGGSIFTTNSVGGLELVSGGNFGAEGGILCSIVLSIGIIYFLLKLRSAKNI